ncbi:hypothetical protein LINGRAHAP2_LOCUS29153 [Linum grandiflorum]
MHSMKMKKEEIIMGTVGVVVVNSRSDSSAIAAAAAHYVGNKVLPITSDTAALPPMVPCSRKGSSVEQDEKRSDSKLKGENISNKSKAISRMKELIRWAAASKSDKNGKFLGLKVLQQFRNRSAIKGIQEQDAMGRKNYNYNKSSNHVDSPRFSLRWEVESSCSTTCSVISMASCPAALLVDDRRKANWITTDSDCEDLNLRTYSDLFFCISFVY